MFRKIRGEHVAPITLGGVKIPYEHESLHWLIVGSTSSGKSTLQDEMLSKMMQRPNSRSVIVDPNGHSVSHFFIQGDVILNPFDCRSPGWSAFNEIRASYDYRMIARSVIPDGHGSDKVWNGYAQNLLAQTMMAMLKRGENTTERLLHWLTVAANDELKTLLTGTSAMGLFEAEAGRALASTKFVISHFLAVHECLQPGDFSLRDWLLEGDGNLYLTWNEGMSYSLCPLISTWTDILCNAILTIPPGRDQNIWLILDELGGLGQICSLQNALTRGRKHNLRVWACLQSVAQIRDIYGQEGAKILESCFRNLVVLGISKADPETAEMLSRSLGEREVERPQYSSNTGPSGISHGLASKRASERLVLPSEISSQPNLEGYLALACDEPIRRIRIKHQNLPVIAPAIMEE